MNPTIPKKPDNRIRVLRGGSWNYVDAARVRAAYRSRYGPSDRSNGLGFRTRLAGRLPR
jgi:formylglycine-generating enzyme required for sulfatase activity